MNKVVSTRTGRRPGNPGTREQIQSAARALFAERGYRGTTLRAIAHAAGVNVALIKHYFGGKEQLFAAAQEMPASVHQGVIDALHGATEGIGARLTRAYLELWEHEPTRTQLVTTVRSAVKGDEAMGLIRQMLEHALADDDATIDPERRRALGLAMGHLLGVAILRHVTRMPSVVEIPLDELIDGVAPAVQLHLDKLD